MKLIKVGGADLNLVPMAWEHNRNNILAAIEKAKLAGVQVLCLPELCISGYNCEDMFYSGHIHQTSWESLQKIVPATKGLIVTLGLPMAHQNRIFNVVALVANGKILGFVAKQHLAGNGIHYEPRWFKPWPEGERTTISRDGKAYPFGDLIFEADGVKIGLEICEDAWVSGRPGGRLHEAGVDIILNPSASHFAFDKMEIRKRFVLEGSRAFGCCYVYTNLLGNEAGRAIYDGGTLIANGGELVAYGQRLHFHHFNLTAAVVDLEANRLMQAQSSKTFKQVDLLQYCVESDFLFPQVAPEPLSLNIPEWESSVNLKEEAFSRAVALGLFDYMRKSYSKGFVVSLSGGADSAACACLVWLMATQGVEQLGMEGFRERLGYFADLSGADDVPQLMGKLLYTAYQPTENSGEVTRNAAKAVAQAIGAVFYELDVNSIYRGYISTVSEALGRELSWEQDDITLQNIQARIRAPSVWMLANISGALLISTSNRSEAAVGYATMDGDTSGGLSPIAGIDKAFLRQWLRWLEQEGLDGKLKIPALRFVNEQQPTAELRPQHFKQTDEADLMPYELLDFIERAAIRDKQPPEACLELLKAHYPQYAEAELMEWTRRFFQLWCRNQWKRERYAPSFHVDDKNLDPKTWCRFPILSSGFREELDQLGRSTDTKL